MKPKTVVTITLLAFVAASVVVLAVKSTRQAPPPDDPDVPVATNSDVPDEPKPLTNGIIAYYFHGDMRCPTCRKIEAYSHEAITSGFAEQLKNGSVQWKVLNYDAPANEDLAAKYDIVAPTVVIVKVEDGQQKRWGNLARVWEFVGDKKAFVDYVQTQTKALLEGQSS